MMLLAHDVAKREGMKYLTVKKYCTEGRIKGARKRYVWEGSWLRLRWHVPAIFKRRNRASGT